MRLSTMPGAAGAVAMRAKVHGNDIAAVGLAVIGTVWPDRTSKSLSRTIIDMDHAAPEKRWQSLQRQL
jgi:hypothetical protein